jgi:hypothetical protein
MYPQTTALPGTSDLETVAYVSTLQRYWQTFPADVRQQAWREVAWRQPQVRPANTPERRLAGMAQLLAAYPGSGLLDTALALGHTNGDTPHVRSKWPLGQALAHLLDVPTRSYWTRRAHLGGRISKGQRLLGLQRARTVVIDAMLPICLLAAHQRADAPLQAHLLTCYHTAPCLPDNHILRYMRHRMLGNAPGLLELVTGARQQQGLLQLFVDFCGNDEGQCQGCEFPVAPQAQ